MKIRIPYISVWDSGVEVKSSALLDPRTGEITEIEIVNKPTVHKFRYQFILLDNKRQLVYGQSLAHRRGFSHWVDLKDQRPLEGGNFY